jgi:hypothetical protein
MTDRFEQRLRLELRSFAEAGVRPIDRDAIAYAAIAQGRRRSVIGTIANALGVGAPAPWTAPSRLAVRLAFLLLLLAALLTSAAAGGWLEKLLPWFREPFPIVEDLGLREDSQLSAFGSTLLSDGRLLLVGGYESGTTANVLLFDPDSKQFTPAGRMVGDSRANPMAIPLADGRVLILGGYHEDPATGEQATVATAELYDPRTGAFRMTAAPHAARSLSPQGAGNSLPWATPQATVLRDGRVFLSGGHIARSDEAPHPSVSPVADIFDPATEQWSQLDIGCDAMRGTQTLLLDGRVLILCVRGLEGDFEHREVDVRARLFDPTTNTFVEAGKPPAAARRATLLPDGRVLLTGFDASIYDPRTDVFTSLQLRQQLSSQRGIPVGRDRVLFLGDNTDLESDFFTYMLDTTTLAIERVERPEFSQGDALVQLPDGRILTVGYQLRTRLLDPTQLP